MTDCWKMLIMLAIVVVTRQETSSKSSLKEVWREAIIRQRMHEHPEMYGFLFFYFFSTEMFQEMLEGFSSPSSSIFAILKRVWMLLSMLEVPLEMLEKKAVFNPFSFQIRQCRILRRWLFVFDYFDYYFFFYIFFRISIFWSSFFRY